ncbi:MAG: hypothetical protein CFH37_00624 [Alphaproteobacteria bacterium MarineAlpha9_Bin7]|nr:MAG: hypothetical protein CFH37_00624 [Alphaproteobacteria bacterium MarineAlpha9_Bin7]
MTGLITTVAGTGERGYTGDGGPATDAQLSEPFMCEFGPSGNLFLVEAANHCLRCLNPNTGTLLTIAGNGEPGYEGDGGPADRASFNEPYALQIDQNGDIYIVDRLNAAVRKIAASTGIITTLAGGQTGKIFKEPNDCFLDRRGGLLVADVQDQRVTRIDLATGAVTPVAGDGRRARAGDGGPALKASIMGARAVCLDNRSNLYICEREGHGVRRVDTDGIMSTVAGTGEQGYDGDGGPAVASTWDGPKAIRCDADNNLLVVDTENHAVRRIDGRTGIVTTVAGGRRGPRGDDGPALAAELDRPHACCIDAHGNLYIADSDNHRVRVVHG